MKHFIFDRIEEMDLHLAREDMNTLNEFYDEIKAEPALQRANRISYIPPNATQKQIENSEQEIQTVFEDNRQRVRASVMLSQ